MDYVSGEILTTSGVKKGYIGFNKNIIVDYRTGRPPKIPICTGVIIPTFVNIHTHIGDSFIRKLDVKLPKDIKKLVAPPNGLKHELLKKASTKELIQGMKESIDEMKKSGISIFCDFREGGIQGVLSLKYALENQKIKSIIFSRPKDMIYDKKEIELLLKNSQGIGLSGISDWDFSELEKVAGHTRRARKKFTIHASERVREDIDKILDLKPNFLVHMINATESDLIRVKEHNIPIVICPRSNAFYDMKPNYKLLKKVGVKILIGTDNAMLNTPNIIDEILFLKSETNLFSDWELLNITTYEARKALNLKGDIQGLNSKGNFVVLDKKSLKPLYISINNLEE